MKEELKLPASSAGKAWWHQFRRATRVPHRHDELEINIVVTGTAAYLVGDRRYELRRHTLLWLFPEQEHILLNESSDYTMWIAVFKRSLLVQHCEREAPTLLEGNPSGDFCRRLQEAHAGRLNDLCREIAEAGPRSQALHNAGMAYLLLLAWQAHLAAADIAGRDVHPAVEAAARLIQHQTETDAMTTIEEIARRSGLSASRLSRLFKEQTGVSLVDFRNRQRLGRYLRIYGEGRRKSITEAAREAGFGSYPQFHRVFRQVMGCSPAQYRRGLPGNG